MDNQELLQPDEQVLPPEPMPARPLWHKLLGAGGLLGAVGGALLLIVNASTLRCMGATRSCQLKYQQRQEQIEKVALEKAEQEQQQEAMDQAPQE